MSDVSSAKLPRHERIAVICVGNKLMLDEGIGPAVYDELMEVYAFPEGVSVLDVGCMSLDMIPYVESCDLIVTVDAVDGTGAEPGTVVRYKPEDMARRAGAVQSAHDLKLADLFDAAVLLDLQTEGLCLGMQVQNMNPSEITIGLTPKVYESLPLLIDTILAELVQRGVAVRIKKTGVLVDSSHRHTLSVIEE